MTQLIDGALTDWYRLIDPPRDHADEAASVVLVHDAVCYMTTEGFCDHAELMEADEDGRALRGVAWQWDPDPTDTTYVVDYAFLLRDASGVRAVHDRHVEGLFAHATWTRILADAGCQVAIFARPLDTPGSFDEVFVCTRPV